MTIPARQLMRKPARIVHTVTFPARRTYWTKMAELIAPLSPMLMSWPREAAVTRVIPMDRITSSEAPKRILGMFPYSTPLIRVILK